jgi:protein-disulfide isomerase
VRITSFVALSLTVLGIAACAHSSPPPFVAGELARTPKGDITVIEFVDFECPYCRAMNSDLDAALASHRDRVRVVRKQVPLAAIHPHALDAARAAKCGEAMGKGDAIADALFRAPPESLTEEGCVAIGAHAGLSPSQFLDCMIDPKTTAEIRADVETFIALGGGGVPVVWIDERRYDGEQGPEEMRRAVEQALSNAD